MSAASAPPRLLQSLTRRGAPLASSAEQRARLNRLAPQHAFASRLAEGGSAPLVRSDVRVLQVNLGKRCNQTCRHCHVDAGPDRREVMPDDVFEACLSLLARTRIATLDITGGAPELHPRFCELVERGAGLGCKVMSRCNLTATLLPNYAHVPLHLARHAAEVVASVPWFKARETDAQRGAGVFDQSITALKGLNELGYGVPGSGLILNLVTNPVGAYLPPNQAALERDFRRELLRRYDLRFNQLFTITNMPISRYLEYLEQSAQLETYLSRLVNAFNPQAVGGLMCRTTLSVGWDGRLYDCDFNQMLDMALPATIFDVEPQSLVGEAILTDTHCFGCTAGNGSSCGGATS
ncbi:MAG TPA: arsenosugar biosynthesis radical SAM (seleno)protein ArsS [Polyangiaceae bacterium]|nr:arsenosugar biosynthesis radical SAM (seleno)protein ArsS [Polyangiaceae bacterium]